MDVKRFRVDKKSPPQSPQQYTTSTQITDNNYKIEGGLIDYNRTLRPS